jgi:hypothetical protein
VQEEERLKGSHGDSLNYVKQNKKRSFLTGMLNHKGNPTGTVAPLLSHMERPHKMLTIRHRTMIR